LANDSNPKEEGGKEKGMVSFSSKAGGKKREDNVYTLWFRTTEKKPLRLIVAA